MASFDAETVAQLHQFLPAEASCANPVDMIASAIHDTYKNVYTIVEKDPHTDAVIVIIVKPPTGTSPEKIIEELSSTIQSSRKTFFLVLMAAAENQIVFELCQKYSIPVFNYPETAAAVLGKMVAYQQIKKDLQQQRPANHALGSGSRSYGKHIADKGKFKQASFEEITKRLAEYQLPFVPFLLTYEKNECIEFHKKHGPLVLKIANPEIIHKSDTGLVFLNLTEAAVISRAYDQLVSRAAGLLPDGVRPCILVQHMIPSGIELVLGYKYDSLYGDVLMLGIGGVMIDLYRDVVFRILPLSLQEIRNMITEIKGFKLLTGYRQGPVFDTNRLVQVIQRFSELVAGSADIVEMDLNPLIWPADSPSPIIVDCRMTVQI
jgi:acetyltransferase